MHALENIRFIESIGTQMENKDYYVVYDKALNKFYSHINCLIDKLKNKKKVYIFGTNTPGSMILSYLKANGVEVCGFLDNDITKENKSYRGVYVYTPERILKYYDKNIVILIASGYQDQMIEQILSYGFSMENIEVVIDLKKEMNDYSFVYREKRKKLNNIEVRKYQIRILKRLKSVCEENHLRYYIAYGTLLGAVRHSGYIPWDDDIDVCMPAEDVIKLQNILENDTQYRLITQYKNDIYLGTGCSLMVDINTISDINRFPIQLSTGISIDVFSLYGIPNDDIEKYIYNTRLLESEVLDNMYSNEKYKKSLNKLNEYLLSFSYEDCDVVGNTLFANYMRAIYKKNLWGKGVKLQFEDEKYNCPQEYKEILKMEYGDYMTPPPEKERQGLHYMNCYE